MIRLVTFIMLIGGQAAVSGQSMWNSYGNQVSKEMAKWSVDFGQVECMTKEGHREFLRIKNNLGEPIGILVLTSAQGRFERFDLMLILNPSGKIDRIRILKYRSEYGSEISNKSWLAQFYIKPDSIFALHKNIDAISGATYSANGLIGEVNAILNLRTIR